jgi:23S rRNA (pseudouridine1915-N3)-methyltransferase
MKRIRIVAVGRIRAPYWRAAAEEYQKRLGRVYRLEETIIKDGGAALPADERIRAEGEGILAALGAALGAADAAVRLDERGKSMDSPHLARYLENLFATGRTPCFIVGGAYGFSPAVIGSVRDALSFGPMTFPHELARVILLEQLYRADSIIRGGPYHHG